MPVCDVWSSRWCARLAVLLIACSLAACAAGGQSPRHHAAQRTDTPATGRTAHKKAARHPVGVLGSFRVGQRSITLAEPAHAGVTGARLGPRKLVVGLRYPRAKGPLPMIVFAPGFMQCGGPYSPMLRAWASAGYVVAVVNFPRSDCLAGSAATEADLVNQPGDMSYAITRLLRLGAATHGVLAGLIDARHIAVAGQSDGGDTVAAIAASTCCADRRVKAAAVLSGAMWPAMPGRFFARPPAAMLFVQGTADTVNLPGCSIAMYRADPAWGRYYLDLFGASHTSPYWGTNKFERIVVRVTVAFFDRNLLGQATAGPTMKRDGEVMRLATLFGHGSGSLRAGPCVT